MRKLSVVVTLLALYPTTIIAQHKINLAKEKEKLLEVHHTDRKAHFQTDTSLILRHAADEFIAVSNGKVSKSSREEVKQFFEGYFKNAKYSEWDDLEPPIIKISNDASMAWMIVRIKVSRTQGTQGGTQKDISFVYAGIMTYEKKNGKWVRVANVSTFE